MVTPILYSCLRKDLEFSVQQYLYFDEWGCSYFLADAGPKLRTNPKTMCF